MDNDTPKSKGSRLPIIAAAIVFVVVVMVICMYQLRFNEVAVVTTFGEPKVVTDPGLHMRLPLPAQKIIIFDKRRQLFVGDARETKTRDNNNLVIRVFAAWRISDALIFYNSVGTMTAAEGHLKTLIASQQDSLVQGHDMADFLSADPDTDPLEALEAELLEAVKSAAAESYGINVEFVAFADISLNEAHTASVLARMEQEQVRIAKEIASDAETQARIKEINAKKHKSDKLSDANTYASKIRTEAVTAAQEEYKKFSVDVEFATFLRKLDALAHTMKTNTTVVLDPSTPPFDLLRTETKRTIGDKNK